MKKQHPATYYLPPATCEPFTELADCLAEIGRNFYSRGWVLGTSGNFSAVVSEEPLRLAITQTGVDKGALSAKHILEIDANGRVVVWGRAGATRRGGQRRRRSETAATAGRPSDEAKLHLAVLRGRQARAVLHTHSVWSTIVSEACGPQGGLSIEGYEMLKGLKGVSTHEHHEWLPIIENSQDMATLARSVEEALKQHPQSHGFLLRAHGLYTWGENLAEAKRHVEILEFLLEVMGRKAMAGAGEGE